MYVLENGCVCCTQREDLEASLEELFWARMRREVPRFARVVVETTGLADPTGVLRIVTGDTLAGTRYEWKSVVTLVDGLTGSKTLEVHAAAAQLEDEEVGEDVIFRHVLALVVVGLGVMHAERVAEREGFFVGET